ncbi:MFS transporter [Saccharopolyspora phatthalungensis]|uniref:Putative MFS transporter n=1 Tax=Saccharopolyspora phatthalungensis TaxID=664693 RepID=A0A840Q999_9PSEU|nr:MFS transporter [Saccharopolyspora phatthalungensis]MBB5156507.1 putative MFS transporter [Saccharopolyspora phatthalungensis]
MVTADSSPQSEGLGTFDDDRHVDRRRRIAMRTIAAGMFVDGYDLIALSGVLVQVKDQMHLGAGQIGLLGASTYFGSMVGAIIFGRLADRLGRRVIFQWTLVCFVAISLLSALVTNVEQLYTARVLLGVAIGAELAAGLAFLNEIAPRNSRGGWAGALPQIMWSTGALSAILVDALLLAVGDENAWRWMFAAGAVPAMIALLARLHLPESPRWLLLKGRTDQAVEALAYFGISTSAGRLEAQAQALRTHGERARAAVPGMRTLVTGPHRTIALIVITLVGFVSLVGGGSSILGPYVFEQIGKLSQIQSVLSGAVIWVGALIGAILSFTLVDRIGRIRAYISTHVALFLVYVLMVTIGFGTWVLVPLYCLYGVFNWIASSISGVLPSELLPTSVRGAANGLAHGLNRFCNGLVVLLVPVGLELLGFRGVVLICGAVGLVLSALAYAYRRYEPARRSIDELSGERSHPDDHGTPRRSAIT